MKKLIYLFVMVMLVSGCATYSFIKYDTTVYKPTNPQDIQIFSFEPPREHIKIGEINYYIASFSAKKTTSIIKKSVAEMGGDAIVVKGCIGLVIKYK